MKRFVVGSLLAILASVAIADSRLPSGYYKSSDAKEVLHVRGDGGYSYYSYNPALISGSNNFTGFVDFSTDGCIYTESSYPYRSHSGNLLAYTSDGSKQCLKARSLGPRLIIEVLGSSGSRMAGIYFRGSRKDLTKIKNQTVAIQRKREECASNPFSTAIPSC